MREYKGSDLEIFSISITKIKQAWVLPTRSSKLEQLARDSRVMVYCVVSCEGDK